MKTTFKSSALLNVAASTFAPASPKPLLEFGAGFRQFLTTFPEEIETPAPRTPIRQPLQFLEATPTIDDCPYAPPSASVTAVQESLSRCLGAAIFLAARPTTKAMSLAGAVNTLRSA